MKAMLVTVTWLSAMGPQMSAHPLPDLAACRQVMMWLAEDVAQIARSNLTRSHGPVLKAGTDEVVLHTEAAGREIARLRCEVASPPRAP